MELTPLIVLEQVCFPYSLTEASCSSLDCLCSVGTPEIAGLTPIQAVEIVRGLKGLNIVGGDLVEVGLFCFFFNEGGV